MLKGKCVILGITGSISAYKMASVASMLVKQNCKVHVIMTHNSTEFITPLTFETLTGNKCLIGSFDREEKENIEVPHISIAKKADLFLVAPASANVISKIANGMADDMLTNTMLACRCKKMIAPAMNTHMFQNPIVQDNITKLEKYGFEIIQPSVGLLACKDIGEGKLPEPEIILEYILKELAYCKDLVGKKVLVTAGATCEAIDPVRYISNHSTGKMGYAIARACMRRGADVTLISGKTFLPKPLFMNTIYIESAQDMFDEVAKHSDSADYIFKAAAVADYSPSKTYDEKVKKNDNDLSILLTRTKDILQYVSDNRKKGQFICGFSMETENIIKNSKLKLDKKCLDMIVANNLKTEGAGFGEDTNIVSIITKDKIEELPKMPKDKVAHNIIDTILNIR